MFTLSLAYLVFTIIRPQDYLTAMMGVPAMPVLLVLAFLFWIMSREKTFAAPQFMLLPAFLLAMVASRVAAGWAGGAYLVFVDFAPIVISFLVIATSVNSRHRLVVTFAVIALCAMILALHGVEQAHTGIGWTGKTIGDHDRIRYVGIFNDPNDLGLLFVMALPMTLYLSSLGGMLGRIFWLCGAALLLYGVYLTRSRGTQLAVLVIAGVYLWRQRGMLTAMVLGCIGLVGMMMMPSTRMTELDASEPSALGRVDAWYTGLHLFMSRPVFGVGAGNFTEYNYLTAHNSFVLVLAETGFFGYILWLAFVGYCFWMVLRILRHRLDAADAEQAREWHEERSLALTLLLSLCGFFAAAFFLSRSYSVMLYLLAAVVTGYYVGARRRFASIPGFSLLKEGWSWLPISVGSIVGLFLIVAVLLHSI